MVRLIVGEKDWDYISSRTRKFCFDYFPLLASPFPYIPNPLFFLFVFIFLPHLCKPIKREPLNVILFILFLEIRLLWTATWTCGTFHLTSRSVT